MPYTQADHDLATEQGGIGMAVALVLVALALVGALLWS